MFTEYINIDCQPKRIFVEVSKLELNVKIEPAKRVTLPSFVETNLTEGEYNFEIHNGQIISFSDLNQLPTLDDIIAKDLETIGNIYETLEKEVTNNVDPIIVPEVSMDEIIARDIETISKVYEHLGGISQQEQVIITPVYTKEVEQRYVEELGSRKPVLSTSATLFVAVFVSCVYCIFNSAVNNIFTKLATAINAIKNINKEEVDLWISFIFTLISNKVREFHRKYIVGLSLTEIQIMVAIFFATKIQNILTRIKVITSVLSSALVLLLLTDIEHLPSSELVIIALTELIKNKRG